MLTIKVLGSGCPNCQQVAAVAKEALAGLGIPGDVIKVTNANEIGAYRLLATPGLVINERVVAAGRIPSAAEVMTWITDELAAA